MKVFRILFIALIVLSLAFVACEETTEDEEDAPKAPATSTTFNPNSVTTQVPPASYNAGQPSATEIGLFKLEITGLENKFANKLFVLNGVGIGGWTGWEPDKACILGETGNYNSSTGATGVAYINKKIGAQENWENGTGDTDTAWTKLQMSGGLLYLTWYSSNTCDKCKSLGINATWGSASSWHGATAAHGMEDYTTCTKVDHKKARTTPDNGQAVSSGYVFPWDWCDRCWGNAPFADADFKFLNQEGAPGDIFVDIVGGLGKGKVYNIIVDARANLEGELDSTYDLTYDDPQNPGTIIEEVSNDHFTGGWSWDVVVNP